MVNKNIDNSGESYEVLVSRLEQENDMDRKVELRDKIDELLGMRIVNKGESYLEFLDIRELL